MKTYEELIKLQDTNNRAIITMHEMLGDDLPKGFEPEPLAVDMLAMLLYTQRKIEDDLAAATHAQEALR